MGGRKTGKGGQQLGMETKFHHDIPDAEQIRQVIEELKELSRKKIE
jgi:hypothetical protein